MRRSVSWSRCLLTWVLASSATVLLKYYGDNDSEAWSFCKQDPFLVFLREKVKQLIAIVIRELVMNIVMRSIIQIWASSIQSIQSSQIATAATSETTTKFYGDNSLADSIFFPLVFLIVFLEEKSRQQPLQLDKLLQLVYYGHDAKSYDK